MEHKLTGPEDTVKMKKHIIREVAELTHFARIILGTDVLNKTFELAKEWDDDYYPIHTVEEIIKAVGLE
jgi:hypothetical protein